MNKKYLYFVLILLILSTNAQKYKKIIHTTDPQARCLDGSPTAFYIHQGNQLNKFLIYLDGDGYCQGQSLSQVMQQCYQKSKTAQGSSNLWSQQRQGQGYLSTNASESQFAGWTKIIIGYCDGSFHQGYRSAPIQYKNSSLYFRGSKIIKSQLTFIQKNYNLSQAQKIVWSGSFAGGIGAYIWSGYLRTYLKNYDKVYTIIDSGVFLNYPGHGTQNQHFATQLQSLYKLSNTDESTPFQVCNVLNAGEEWKCFLLQYNYQYLKGNFLFINSEYDAWAISNILRIKSLVNASTGTGYTLTNCTKQERDAIEKYREDSLLLLFEIMQLEDQSSSFWSIACSNHVYSSLRANYESTHQRVPQVTGSTVRSTVEGFAIREQRKIINMDLVLWPNNHPCSI